MFRYMERNADGTTVLQAHRNLNIDLMTFHVLAKHPHLPHFIQSIHNRSFYIVLWLYVHDDLLAYYRINFQSR